MRIKYDIERIKAVIDDICSITGISIAVSDTKYNEIYSNETTNDTFCHKILNTKTGEMRCHHSDRDMLERCTQEKKPISHICHAGLRDTVVPILRGDILVGFIIIGRVRPALTPSPRDSYGDINMTREEYEAHEAEKKEKRP